MDEAKANGYDAALKLTDKTARTVWSVFAGLLATNGFLVSLAAFLATQSRIPVQVTVAHWIGGFGLLICIACRILQ